MLDLLTFRDLIASIGIGFIGLRFMIGKFYCRKLIVPAQLSFSLFLVASPLLKICIPFKRFLMAILPNVEPVVGFRQLFVALLLFKTTLALAIVTIKLPPILTISSCFLFLRRLMVFPILWPVTILIVVYAVKV